MASTTRTLNPLHFEDLEPHRFEDLIRQLVYDFRPWKRLEPTGRLGADDGIDIRGVEAASVVPPELIDDQDEEDAQPAMIERLWIVQCKREKSLGPSDVKKIIKEAIPEGGDVPNGFILTAACEFSKKSRDTFILELRDRGVEEFYLWGKADLEDMLFLPKNDYLLFAYFGISLQIRRRALKTTLRSRLSNKKVVHRLFPGEDRLRVDKNRFVLIDANWEFPVYGVDFKRMILDKKIAYCQLLSFAPDRLYLLSGKYLACVHEDQQHWDALFECNLLHAHNGQINPQGYVKPGQWSQTGEDPYNLTSRLDSGQRKICELRRLLHLDQIVAVDLQGHSSMPGPIIFVEPHSDTNLFEDYKKFVIAAEYGSNRYEHILIPREEDRSDLFFSSTLRGTFPPLI